MALTPREEREMLLREGLLREQMARPLPSTTLGYAPGMAPGGALRDPNGPVPVPAPEPALNAPTAPQTASGNRRDSIQEVPRSERSKPTLAQALNPFDWSHGSDDASLALALSMMTGRSAAEGIGQGIQAFRDVRQGEVEELRAQEKHDLAKREADLRLQKLTQEVERGELVHVGNGFFYNKKTGEFVQPDEETLEAMLKVERSVAQAKSVRSRSPYQQTDGGYDAEGNWVTSRFNPNTGAFEYQVDGQWTTEPPEGFTRGVDSFQKHLSKADGKQYESIIEKGEAASSQIPVAQYTLDLIENNPDLYFGTGADSITELKKLGVSLGLSPDQVGSVADAELLRSLTMNQVMNWISQTKGAISEKEMDAFMAASPGLTRSREGNIRMLQYQLAVANRAKEKAQFFAENTRSLGYAETNRRWNEYINDPANYVFNDLVGGGAGRGKTYSPSSEEQDLLNKYLE